MSHIKDLQHNGYVFDTTRSIWVRPGFSSIAYNDGDVVEQNISKIIDEASDLSVLSSELRQHCTNWPNLYHLSSSRANILRPCQEQLRGARVLEIGAGCGAITRYLGEAGADVLALEGSLRRATIARSRTRDLSNVAVVADRFAEFSSAEPFDVITLIGVLEYANLFSPGQDPFSSMLQRVKSMLKPGGLLIIAIENQLGLKYFAGSPEDHIGVPMYGLENQYNNNQAQTFGHNVLTQILSKNGYSDIENFLPFPDYKFPTSILSESALNTPGFDAAAFAWQSVRRDPQFPDYTQFRQELVWPEIFKNNLALALSNSFLLVAKNGFSNKACKPVLAYHYSTSRKAEFCKETLFRLHSNGSIGVHCQPLHVSAESTNAPLTQHLPAQETSYTHGCLMSWQFVRTLTCANWSFNDIFDFYKRYRTILIKTMHDRGINVDAIPSEGDFSIPGELLDLIPQNIILSSADNFTIIDQEWSLNRDILFSQLAFRSLLNMSGQLSSIAQSADSSHVSWGMILQKIFQAMRLDWTAQTEADLIEFETTIQEAASGHSSAEHYQHWMSRPIPQHKVTADIIKENEHLLIQIRESAPSSKALSDELENSRQRIRTLSAEISQLQSSHSWKITAPLRYIKGKLQSFRNPTRTD